MKDNTQHPLSLPPRSTLRLKPSHRMWVCWRQGGSRPKVKHSSVAAAFAERDRIIEFHGIGTRVDVFELVPAHRGSR